MVRAKRGRSQGSTQSCHLFFEAIATYMWPESMIRGQETQESLRLSHDMIFMVDQYVGSWKQYPNTVSRLLKPSEQAFVSHHVVLVTFLGCWMDTNCKTRKASKVGLDFNLQSHEEWLACIHAPSPPPLKFPVLATPQAQNGAPLRWRSRHQHAVLDPDEWRLLSPQSVRRGGAQSPAGRGAQKNDQRRVRAPKIVRQRMSGSDEAGGAAASREAAAGGGTAAAAARRWWRHAAAL